MNKTVAFAGHRYDWQNIGVEDKLKKVIKQLVDDGFTTFFNGGHGRFDKISAKIVNELKKNNNNLKLVHFLSSYNNKIDKTSMYDYSIYPELEMFYPKQRIIKRNEWMIDNCEVLVCHVIDESGSGAYRTLKYAQKKSKRIIRV